MSSSIQCFMLEPTHRAQRSLRRYASGSTCALPHGYHDASVTIGEEDFTRTDCSGTGDDKHAHDDPRWSAACACGYVFQDSDVWQTNIDLLYARGDTGALHTLDNAPVGAMWFAPWYEVAGVGPDGKHLVVKTPGGDWLVDQDRIKWTRTGTPPFVTANPSILFHGSYHGWLRDGVLVEC